ncbi:hypothetical protein APHAL10511_000429 [Amanita phalloides]|nr:hypothetical protein APHAL10511_000429 [Amanita phalloides]
MSASSPVRAIRSALVARPQPSVPPSQQAYIPLAKHVLQQRLVRHIFLHSALVCWIQAAFWNVWILGGLEGLGTGIIAMPLYASTLMLAGAMWLAAALPAVVVRKAYLTTKLTPASSPSALLQSALSKKSTSRSILTYFLSSLALLALHLVFDGHANLRLKHPLYLNPRLIYLILSQTVVALIYTFRNILLDRFVFRFSSSPFSSSRLLITPLTIIHTILVCILLTSLSVPLTCILFALCRFLLPLFYRLPLLPYLLAPFTAHFLRGHWTLTLPLYHFPLLVRGWFVAYTTFLTWEFASVFFESSTSQPITVSQLTADLNVALVSGSTASPSPFPFHYFAYLELRDIAPSHLPHSISLRSALFSDQKYTPSLWSHLVRESLLLLGRDFQTLSHRGHPPSPPSQPAPAPGAQPGKNQPSTPFPTTPIKYVPTSSSAFRSPQAGLSSQSQSQARTSPVQAAVNYLASDGPLARAVDEGTGEVEEAVSNVPELFRSVLRERRTVRTGSILPGVRQQQQQRGEPDGSGVVVAAGAGAGGVGGCQTPSVLITGWVEAKKRAIMDRSMTWIEQEGCPGWLKLGVKTFYDWWTRERVHKVVENGLPNWELDLVVFQMLGHYVCASLAEDPYGVVQRDIPKILEAMVRFLGEVDKWRGEISGSARPSLDAKPERGVEAERARANAILSEMIDGLKECIGMIVRTFGDKLTAFKIPPGVAKGLQTFLDFC